MATSELQPAESSFLLRNVSWRFYETCLAEIGDRAVRLTYHRGSLEMMSPSKEHERCKRAMGRIIEALTEELNIPIQSVGSTTWRRKELECGLEPDECYYVEHESAVRGRDEWDTATDPPPDLAVEIEISKPAVDRMAIYAGLGIRELWRYDGESLSVWRLETGNRYERSARSLSFPFLPLEEVSRFMAARNQTDETTWIRSFRAWVREHVAAE
jgi:Uma2 family endonuclease